MAWTVDDIDALETAIAQGVSEVQYSDGSRTVFRSLREMRETLALIRTTVQTPARPVRSFTVTPRPGY
jgi:hypothetical protein